MSYEAALKDYTSFDFNDSRWTRKVYRRGTGPVFRLWLVSSPCSEVRWSRR